MSGYANNGPDIIVCVGGEGNKTKENTNNTQTKQTTKTVERFKRLILEKAMTDKGHYTLFISGVTWSWAMGWRYSSLAE